MSNSDQNFGDLLRVDRSRDSFRVARKAFADQAVFDAEQTRIFNRCWLYIGHESELGEVNQFVTRRVARRNLVFTRDRAGTVRCLINVCPHRGATVVREKSGTAKGFKCIYHGWSWWNDGSLAGLAQADGFSKNFNACGEVNLVQVPRMENYRGFYFINFDLNAQDLEQYLGRTTEYIDLVMDQSDGKFEVVGGTQEYSIRCNWKGLAENSIDIYHAPGTHPTYMEYILAANPGKVPNLSLDQGVAIDLGNGHGVVEYYAPYGRPIADWTQQMGAAMKPEIEAYQAKLEARLGVERAHRVAKRSFNLLIFPNFAVLNIHAVALRSFQPVRPGYMEAMMWSLAPAGESRELRACRLNNFLEFLGPGGFATPDDIEALETCQLGYESAGDDVPWNEVSKGMNREGNENWMDEGQIRSFWKEWNARVSAEP